MSHHWAMVRVLMLLFLVELVLTGLALISCLSVESTRDVRALPRPAWLVVILLLPIAGAVAWFLAGRPAPARGPGGSLRRAAAPDDDPEFLRSLGGRDGRERDLFDRWESDLTGPGRDPAAGGGLPGGSAPGAPSPGGSSPGGSSTGGSSTGGSSAGGAFPGGRAGDGPPDAADAADGAAGRPPGNHRDADDGPPPRP
ncbi:PLD nuclease N-terminal domain-containing protein [Plantactinospora siamensis]|uniref:PLD nuclease N-terminal domain-containing protein n=1 Tax=Plantactinospora siamensis TaxID=555372 RepID=A0ABV6NTB9_9ACTN